MQPCPSCRPCGSMNPSESVADYRDIVSTWPHCPTSERRRPLLRAPFLNPLEIFDERLDPRLDRLL
jgi:hypothetical protein